MSDGYYVRCSSCQHLQRDPTNVVANLRAKLAEREKRIRLARDRFSLVDWDDGSAREDMQRFLNLRRSLPKRAKR